MSILTNLALRVLQIKERKITDVISLLTAGENILAVDFDNTLCDWAFPSIGKEKEEVTAFVRQAKQLGWKIIIHTCRTNKHWGLAREATSYAMIAWLKQKNIPFDAIWGMRYYNNRWEFSDDDVGKPVANFYIDDSSIELKNLAWLLRKLEGYGKL